MNRDPRVDAYIDRAAPFARPILEHVRGRVQALLPDAEETTKWSAPAYTVGGKILLVMAAFKAHAALNFWRGQELRGEAAQADAMGQFGKLASIDDLPADRELDALILKAAELAATAPAPRKTKHAPKAAAGASSRIRGRARFGSHGQGCPREFSAQARSANISTGSRKRSRRQPAPSASRRRSNG